MTTRDKLLAGLLLLCAVSLLLFDYALLGIDSGNDAEQVCVRVALPDEHGEV